MDLMGILISKLSGISKEFGIFMRYHFDIVKEQSLTPKLNLKGESLFPVQTKIKPVDISLINKLKYYREDLSKFDIERYSVSELDMFKELMKLLNENVMELEECYT